ncbi:hypothetical protein ABPG75_011225 [Micractinium tetrahymenae]
MLAPLLLGPEAQPEALLLPITAIMAAVQTAARRLLAGRLPRYGATPPLLALLAAGAVSRAGMGLPGGSGAAPLRFAAAFEHLLAAHPSVARLLSFFIMLLQTGMLNNAAKTEIRRAANLAAGAAASR